MTRQTAGRACHESGRSVFQQVSSGYWALQTPRAAPLAKLVDDPWAGAAYRAESDFMAYASARLHELGKTDWPEAGYKRISRTVIEQTRTILRAVQGEDSVYPSIAPDGEGGAMLYWRVAKASIEIDVEADGTRYARVTDSSGKVVLDVDRIDVEVTRTLRKSLATLSSSVGTANPNWRAAFRR